MSLYEFDQIIQTERLCGVDEAGRGPLAGPVVASAVILPLEKEMKLEGLNDSKKLSPQKREELYDKITKFARAWSIGSASVEEIESVNILQATFLAMRRAIDNLPIKPSFVLVDGNRDPNLPVVSRCVVKGDAQSANIAAASIIAKVTRDRIMTQFDMQYPQYGFAKHKGYGTALHYSNLSQYGISPIHRKSFLKKYFKKQEHYNINQGHFGEKVAYKYLCKQGYQVIARNYHSQYGEIDLIAIKDDVLCFVEVKFRAKTCLYSPKEAVTVSKQRKIVKTALCFLQKHPTNMQPRFDVIELQPESTGIYSVCFIQNAFSPEEEYGFL